jgi:hypothetical protein
VPGAVPPIVREPLWLAAQAKHGTRPFGVGRPWHRPYLLGGPIICAQCGKRFWANKQGRGWEIAYYECGGYVASGTAVCDGFRIPLSYLETAVLDGIQKRLQRVLDPAQLRRRLLELLLPAPDAAPPVQAVERQLRATEGKLARLVETLAAGPEHLPTVRRTLVTLKREHARLETQLVGPGRRPAPPAPTASRGSWMTSLRPCPGSRRCWPQGRLSSGARWCGASWRGSGSTRPRDRRSCAGTAYRVACL